MAKTRKRGGGTHVMYFENADNKFISADPIFSNEYQSVGIITSTSIMAINAFRKLGTNILNGIGNSGFEMTIYAQVRNEAIHKIRTEMKNKGIAGISSFRIEYIENPTHVIANCYGTALKKR